MKHELLNEVKKKREKFLFHNCSFLQTLFIRIHNVSISHTLHYYHHIFK